MIVPIWKSDEQRALVLDACVPLRARLADAGVRVHLDGRDTVNPGAKFYEWERKGVPVRLEVGPRDVESDQVVIVRRFLPEGTERKRAASHSSAVGGMSVLLDEIQDGMLAEAARRREERSVRGVSDFRAFQTHVEERSGFVYTGWCGSAECANEVQAQTRATIRVIPDAEFRSEVPPETCLVCGGPGQMEVVWAKAY